MVDKHERVEAEAGPDARDSFEVLLKQAAHVSGPAVSGLGLALRPGNTLLDGRFRIVRRIGEGGMGVVFEAYDEQRRGSVALKTLTRLDAASVYRLKNEFRSLAEVSHPSLCRLHELFGEGAQWFFTMELVEGERFDRWVRPHDALDEARLRAALPQLSEGIAAIHAAGKLHRDLKPSNVLVTPNGRVVVLDFGLAVDPDLGGVGQTVMDESVSGTPAYMAPEQAAGLPAMAASDFYALGVMLFEALTGKLPFGGRAHEMLTDKQRLEAPSASSLWNEAPSDLDVLCSELLLRDPAARPDHAALRTALGHGSTPTFESESRSRSYGSPRASGTTLSPDAAPELLGRETELRALHHAYAATVAGKPAVVFVTGESGMGKSALVTAFLDELRAQGRATVLAGRCYERENVPFKGFDSVVDELSRHLRRLPAQEAAALLPREAYALARVFPVLDRVPVVAEAPKKDVPDPNDLKRRAFEAFGELLARMRDRAPLCVFIDDVQWLDQDSVRFMRALFVHAEPVPALLICAHRSEGAPDNALLQSVLQAASDNPALHMRTLEVGPLPASALRSLAQRLLPEGSNAVDAATFADEARGNPFFAAELARAAALRTPGAPPASLAAALALHVASLPPGAQRLLSLLALAGQPLATSLVVEAAGLEDGHSQLDPLRSEQLVRVSLDEDGERSVECYHDKIREHVASTLDAPRARELALGLSRALLAQPDSDAELLARCLDLAGLPEDAAVHAARAAETAFAALAFGRAAKLYADALDHGRFDPTRTQALRVSKAEALAYAGQGERAAEAFIAAAAGASAEQADELTRKAGEQYLLCGDLEHGRALLGQALRGVGLSLPQSLGASLASVVWSRTRLRLRGLSFIPRSEHDAATLRELEALETATTCLIRTDQVRAADFGARWVVRALDAGHSVELARALAHEVMFASFTGASDGRIGQLITLCDRLCEQTADQYARGEFLHYRGVHNLLRRGNSIDALGDFGGSLEMMAAHPFATSSYDRGWVQYFRALSLWACGRAQDAGVLAQAQLEDALARGDHTVSTGLAGLVALTLVAVDRPTHAERLLEEATARLRPGEVTVQDQMIVQVLALPHNYRGRARDAWYLAAPHVDRLFASFQGRVMQRGMAEMGTCGQAAAAAQQAQNTAERRDLTHIAERLAKRALAAAHLPGAGGCPDAVLACLRGDRQRAVTALRQRLQSPMLPINEQPLRRRLGELLGNDEGKALIAEADAFLRAGGVVHPARFVAAVMPGIELASEPSST